jgi:Fe-S cluster assembly iron-binding protein IscA
MTQEQLVTMTPEAAAAIQALMEEQELENHALRIFISGVG